MAQGPDFDRQGHRVAQLGFDVVAGNVGGHQENHGHPHQQNGGHLQTARGRPEHHGLQPCLAIALHQQIKAEQGDRRVKGFKTHRAPARDGVVARLGGQTLKQVNAQKEHETEHQ